MDVYVERDLPRRQISQPSETHASNGHTRMYALGLREADARSRKRSAMDLRRSRKQMTLHPSFTGNCRSFAEYRVNACRIALKISPSKDDYHLLRRNT